MLKRIISLFLVVVMCLSVTTFAHADDAPVELTVVVCRRTTDITESFNQKHWAQDSQKACNVKINWIELTEGQIDEPLAALLAGDLPDVIFMGNKVSDALISANSKLWQAITVEEIKTLCPNVYAMYEKYFPDWENFLTYPDGNIYGLMSGSLSQTMNCIWGVQYLNYQWLDNLGLKEPTNMQEFHDMLVAFKEKDANGNGDPNDEIPIDFCNNHYAANIMNFASSWGISNGPVSGEDPVYYSIKDGQVVGSVNTSAFREYLEFFYQLGQEGLLNLEGFSQSEEQYKANLSAEKVGIFWGYGPYNYINTDYRFNYEGFVPVAADGYTTTVITRKRIFANRNGFVITTACKNREAALKWYDYMSTPTHNIEVNVGEQDAMWKLLDDDLHFRVNSFASQEAQDAAIAEAYPELIGKSFNMANTTGYVNNGPFMPYQTSPDMNDLRANSTCRMRALQKFIDANVIAPPMNQSIVPAEAREELDFMTDGLANTIEKFVADSIINGVTDASWSNFQDELEKNNYSFYLDWYNRYLHNEL